MRRAEQRERCFDLVCAGAPLREAADALGAGLVAAQAAGAGVHRAAAGVSARSGLRLAHLQPDPARRSTPSRSGSRASSHACEAGGRDYALWIARQADLAEPAGRPVRVHGGVGLVQPATRPAGPPPAAPAVERGDELQAGARGAGAHGASGCGSSSTWAPASRGRGWPTAPASGFNFVALRTVEDFIAESEALENCLDQYADQLHARAHRRLLHPQGRAARCLRGDRPARRGGDHADHRAAARARATARAPPEVWQATFAWLGGQRLEPLSPLRHAPKPMKRIEARRKLWSPYLEVLAGTRYELRLPAHGVPAAARAWPGASPDATAATAACRHAAHRPACSGCAGAPERLLPW